jgi:hypothetical protein
MFPSGEEIRFGRSSSRSYEPETDLILSRETHCLESKRFSDAAKSVGQPWRGLGGDMRLAFVKKRAIQFEVRFLDTNVATKGNFA